jgi:DNA-binding transcriptional regulator PaaX
MNQKTKNTAKSALVILGTIGLIGSALLVPNILVVADKIFNITGRKKFRSNLSELKKKKFIEVSGEGANTKIRITERGRVQLLRYNFEDMQITRPRKWDKKWRVVIFDVPENKKTARDALARKLKQLGFFRLQKSTFIFPFDCKKEIDFVAAFFNVYDNVSYLVCDDFSNSERARKYFSLV